MDWYPIQGGGVEILLVTSCYRNWNECWPDGPLGTCMQTLLPPSELPFIERVLVQNLFTLKSLDFHANDCTSGIYFHTNNFVLVFVDSFFHRGKNKLGIGLFIHDLIREPLIEILRMQKNIFFQGHPLGTFC